LFRLSIPASVSLLASAERREGEGKTEGRIKQCDKKEKRNDAMRARQGRDTLEGRGKKAKIGTVKKEEN
jgi:hypothetical protein